MRLRRVLLVAVLLIVAGVAGFFFRPLTVLSLFSVGGRISLWRAGITGQTVTLGPYQIHYLEGGQGMPLLLVHGLGGQARDWTPWIPVLARDYRVIALDLLGFGESSKPMEADYSIALQAKIVRQFLESQHLSKVHLVGYSMGGWVSLKVASESPERIDHLVLVASPSMTFQPEWDVHILKARDTTDLQGLFKAVGVDPPPMFIQRDILREGRANGWIVARAVDSMMSGQDVLDGKLQNVRMPIFLVWGKRDHLIPMTVADSLKRELPQAVLQTFDSCGHGVPFDCPVLPEVQKFLGSE